MPRRRGRSAPPPGSRHQTEVRGKCISSDGGATGSRRVNRQALIVYDLTAGKTYTCRVQAENPNGFGASSNPSNRSCHSPNR